MATKKEIEKELKIALEEIGDITPWYDKKYKVWIFSHQLYPVEYSGETAEEVIKNYPLYMKEFITQRLKQNLSKLTEKKTKGKGGYRPGAGRPKGTKKEAKRRIYLPVEVADWLKDTQNLHRVEKLMHKYV